MKTKIIRIIGFAAVGSLSAVLGGMAEEAPNLLKNPGFEEEAKADMYKNYEALREHGVRLPEGRPAIMPAGVYVNPADGWSLAGKEAAFEYLTGAPGQEVHAGRHAIRILSPKCSAGTGIGQKLEVVVGAHETAIQVDTGFPVSFYARGKATVTVDTYLYDGRHRNIYGEEKSQSMVVEPAQIQVDDVNSWKQYQAVIKITSPDVGWVILVLHVQGDVAIDDVVLRSK